MDLGTGERKPQGIGSRTGEENVAGGSRTGAKAVREYKPQGIGSHRAVEHVGIGTRIGAGDLLA